MNHRNIKFKNQSGQTLSGRLELPSDQHPHNFALFAHCFTCNKNYKAIVNIGRALTHAGFGVLRFDFTGLGESGGEFQDSTFSANIEDLVAAAKWLEKQYASPALLVGHSLGGTAALFAYRRLPALKAVAVINAPADPTHVKRLIRGDAEQIIQEGKATVNIGGRNFTIQKQFLDDLKQRPLSEVLQDLNNAILILHTPQDTVVSIENAEQIFTAARHPKSFISLDGADHLLSNANDSRYAGEVIAAWARRYIQIPPEQEVLSRHEVAASLDAGDQFTTYMKLGDHDFIADEPQDFGGNNFGPSPYQYLAAALAACTAMTVQMYARRKNWTLQNVTVHVSHSKDYAKDCAHCEDQSAKLDTLTREISLEGSLSAEEKKRLKEIADKCPVHRTMQSELQIITTQTVESETEG